MGWDSSDINEGLQKQLESIRTEINNHPMVDESWGLDLESIIDKVEENEDILNWCFDRIDELENMLDEIDIDDDEDTEAIEVTSILDQMKVTHLRNIFEQYSLEEMERMIPDKKLVIT